MICPKCGYERTDRDDPLIPDYECPACGIVYAKYLKIQRTNQTIKPFSKNAATERQREFATELGINIPIEATKQEASLLIDLKLSDDKLATDRHKSFAKSYNINDIPEQIGKKELFDRIKWALTDASREQELVEWFVFRVYRSLINGKMGDAIDSPSHPVIKDAAAHLIHSQAIVTSIKRYKGRDLIWFGDFIAKNGKTYTGGSKSTIAYKEASSLLRERLGIAKHIPPQKQPGQSKKQSNGCLGLIILAALFYWLLH